jgi:hypothetical protein
MELGSNVRGVFDMGKKMLKTGYSAALSTDCAPLGDPGRSHTRELHAPAQQKNGPALELLCVRDRKAAVLNMPEMEQKVQKDRGP